jgi:hypothetical protein
MFAKGIGEMAAGTSRVRNIRLVMQKGVARGYVFCARDSRSRIVAHQAVIMQFESNAMTPLAIDRLVMALCYIGESCPASMADSAGRRGESKRFVYKASNNEKYGEGHGNDTHDHEKFISGEPFCFQDVSPLLSSQMKCWCYPSQSSPLV